METLLLFAQRPGGPFGPGPGPGPRGGGGPPPEFWAAYYGTVCVMSAVGLVVTIFFLLTLSRCLSKISPRNRQMEPGMVWLNLIPCFSIVWIFITVIRVGDSLIAEFDDRRLRMDGDGGKTLGLVYAISLLVCGPVALIMLILYWVKIAGYSAQLEAAGRGGYDDRDYDRDRDRDDDDRDRGRDDYRRGEDRYR